MDLNKLVYLDNNATTLMPDIVKKEIFNWFNKGNASAVYADKIGTTELIQKFKERVAASCDFDLKDYSIIINSGASESNNFILKSTVKSYIQYMNRQPHVIITAIEHKSLIECAQDMERQKLIELTIVQPDISGRITLENIKKYVQPSTCLVCVMFSNNETGVINEINKIGYNLANRKPSIPFYVDCTQSMGKIIVKPALRHITAFCGSFHKMQGPPGLGIIVCNTKFLNGYKLCAEICGSQNNGIRGGTENIPYIAGAVVAMRETFTNRERKNKELLSYQMYVLKNLFDKIPYSFFENWTDENIESMTAFPNYKNTNFPPKIEMIVIGSSEMETERRVNLMMPNTLMISFIKHNVSGPVEGGGDVNVNARPICNFKMVDALMKKGVIVGLGSACNQGKPSYVLKAMGVPDVIGNSAIRISFGDANDENDARVIVREILFTLVGFSN
jgi:cysteine desulfurase